MNRSARILIIAMVMWMTAGAIVVKRATAGDPDSARPAIQSAAQQAASDPGLERFRSIYKELVETNTTLSAGDCTEAALRMSVRLKAAGYPAEDMKIFVPDGHPKEGGLIAVLHGTDPNAKAILMLAHVDVVEAKREDWTRDPFKLIEEDGYFYGRGTSDMKAQAAIWVDNMIRYREEGFKPKRSIKLALTCGEETNSALNGAGWLAKNERQAIDAEFALTEGVDGDLDAKGNKIALEVLAAEKTSQNYVLEATNPGGHSSRPVPDNAIYHLVRAVDRVSRYEFPVQLNDANRGYFTGMAKVVGGENGAAMLAVVKNPQDHAAVAVLDKDVNWHAMLRTTCVATMLTAGHATNALPQRAKREYQLPYFSRRVSRRSEGATDQNCGRSGGAGNDPGGSRAGGKARAVDTANPEADRTSGT